MVVAVAVVVVVASKKTVRNPLMSQPGTTANESSQLFQYQNPQADLDLSLSRQAHMPSRGVSRASHEALRFPRRPAASAASPREASNRAHSRETDTYLAAFARHTTPSTHAMPLICSTHSSQKPAGHLQCSDRRPARKFYVVHG